MRKILLSTDEEIETFAISNNTEDSVYHEPTMEYEPSTFQALKVFWEQEV